MRLQVLVLLYVFLDHGLLVFKHRFLGLCHLVIELVERLKFERREVEFVAEQLVLLLYLLIELRQLFAVLLLDILQNLHFSKQDLLSLKVFVKELETFDD